MAIGVPSNVGSVDITYKAAADLSDKQYYFLKLTSDRVVNIVTGTTDLPIGVLQNKPADTNRAAVVRVVGESYVSSGEALTAGWLIGTSTGGQAERKASGTETTEYVVGQVTTGTSSTGDLAVATISCAAPCRAA